ncbi:DUF2335 domain-containing protein [Roseobacter sp. HKCCD9010]|uniref:DUF2335 domain-containing protein n=1 Tax=unclassified Roseobacter TaxID=196798 RepID=UPI0014921BB3|nr:MULTISPECIES: DUF2335 domain-containing protein [unclassified Roseobacter]MBF9048527.1 DUF2335 domain-containing protein [Rhodobacterales bacterium HKCCD4356]NNV10526.1 DUF2335 domain-containing protein [Roseobacter sp. HKCCD7357]NNV14711.1 DUF2335 domain-containing protein [Roseobacter sp. HKCCD8768]NNV24170.1 DUF2335 domain-containing protein [Roseobacter sp. HKCCD8192]NNV28427.1 DUF2335 domain-containing protein [Roseobacter sp. HKCCD9061]
MSDTPDNRPEPEVISREDWDKLTSEEKDQFSVRLEGFQSPLLPPEVLQRYGNVIPNLDKKLVEWSESETTHRRQLEREAFEEARLLRSRSSMFGPIVAIAGLVIAGLVSVFNESWSGSFTAAVIAIVSVGGPFAARILASRINHRQMSDEE